MNIEYLADHRDVITMLAQWFYDEWAYLHPERSYSDVERLITEKTGNLDGHFHTSNAFSRLY